MPLRAVLAALLVATCWGGNYAATKFAFADFPPMLALLLRFVAVAAVLAPFALRHKLPRMRDMLFISMTLIVIQFALIFSGMYMGLSITTVIIATQLGVPFACVLAAVVFKDYLGPWRSFGLAIAFLGIVVVAGTPNASEHWGAFLLAVCGSLSWGVANIYMKRLNPQPVVVLLFWPALFSLLPLALLSALLEQGQWVLITSAHLSSWLGIAYSMIFSSIIGYGLWNYLIKTYPMSQVVPYSLLAPMVGIASGAIIFGEAVTMQVMMGAALTLVGVGVISVRRPQLAEANE